MLRCVAALHCAAALLHRCVALLRCITRCFADALKLQTVNGRGPGRHVRACQQMSRSALTASLTANRRRVNSLDGPGHVGHGS
eukprot:6878870-Alexandrium_andersonii.AAC.1